MAKTPFMRLMAEQRQRDDTQPDQYLGYSPADVDAIVAYYSKRKPSSELTQPLDVGSAMAVAPLVGAKGALRGALSTPGFLGDVYNYAKGATSVATGHPENVTMPDDFKYGQQGLADWLAKNIPGLGYDEQLPQADALGELLGNLAPTSIVRHAAGVAAKPVRAARLASSPSVSAYSQPAQLQLQDLVSSLPEQNFAQGGSVQQLRDTITQLRKKHA